MKPVIIGLGSFCFALWITTALALADGESRPATVQEKNFILHVLKKFEKAMPKEPQGWVYTERTEVKAPDYIGVGEAMGPMRVYYRVKWEDQAGKMAAQKRMAEESRSIQMPDSSTVSAMNVEMDTLTRKMTEAIQKGDAATVEKLQKELEKLGEKHEKAFAATNAQARKIQQSEPTDLEVDVQLATNQFEATLYHAVRQAPIKGVVVYRVEEKKEDTPCPGASYLFLGNWEPRNQQEYLLMRAEPRSDMPPAAVQTIQVTIRGDDGRARQMINAMDWEGLKGMLGK